MQVRFPLPIDANYLAMLVDMEFHQYGPSSWLLHDLITGRRYDVATDLAKMEPMWRQAIEAVLRKRPQPPS